MNYKKITSILSISFFAPLSLAIEITGFSAGTNAVQASTGNLNISSETEGMIGFFGFSTASIDISMATSPEEMGAIILNTDSTSESSLMLENYPAAPVTAEGIAAYQSITGSTLTTDFEFKTNVDAYLVKNKYSGIPVGFASPVSFITQTADNLIISKYNETEQAEDIFVCSTSSFSISESVSTQQDCALIDTVPQTDHTSHRNIPNGSFQSNLFVYNHIENWFSGDSYKFYDDGGLKNISSGLEKKISPNHTPIFGVPANAYDHTDSGNEFYIYDIYSSDDITPTSITERYGDSPTSILYISGRHAYYDSTNTDGVRILKKATTYFPIPGNNFIIEELLSVPLKSADHSEYGFSDQLAVLNYGSENIFLPDSAELLGLAYYGSNDLSVYTPVIYDLDSELFTYLAPYAIEHLENTTPEGFVEAVRAAVLSSLPETLTASYPDLPDNLTGLDIDPDITPVAFRALIDEKIIRVATSGVLEDFIAENPISVNTMGLEVEYRRWSSNELQFTSNHTLRAPYASYKLGQVEEPNVTITTSTTELMSARGEAAVFTIEASGTFRRLLAKCTINDYLSSEDSTAITEFNEPEIGFIEGMTSVSSTLSSDKHTAFITYEADEEITTNGTALTVSLTAIKGEGDVNVQCGAIAYNGLGSVESNFVSTTVNISAPTTITGQFTSSDNALQASDISSANLIAEGGARYPLTIKDNLSFSQAAGDEGNYTISAAADGYILSCADTSAALGTTTMGELEFLRGDVNGDGKINRADLRSFYLRSFVAGDYDLNNDGVVNRADRDIIHANIGAVQCDL